MRRLLNSHQSGPDHWQTGPIEEYTENVLLQQLRLLLHLQFVKEKKYRHPGGGTNRIIRPADSSSVTASQYLQSISELLVLCESISALRKKVSYELE